MSSDHRIRVAFYGAGHIATGTHIPNLLRMGGVDIVALSDVDDERLKSASETLGIERTYVDAHEMLDNESIDVLYSVVPAFARTDVEIAAVEKGIHLFSEKPQAMTMKLACAIDDAVARSGVVSTVGFRERYRPMFQKARDLLSDKEIVHIHFQQLHRLPGPVPAGFEDHWRFDPARGGSVTFDWGVHAVDYCRFMSGLDIVRAQAFRLFRPSHRDCLSSSFNFLLSNGGTMTVAFTSVLADSTSAWQPWFTFYYEGGYLAINNYETITENGLVVYNGEEFDPWYEHDRVFVEAVQSGRKNALLNDYHDGLFSLSPVLAGLESARRGGECIELERFVRE